MTIFNKIKWILGVSLVFLLILATNLVDKRKFQRVNDAVVSIYDDRLVVKDIILEMTKITHEKEIAYLMRDTSYFNGQNKTGNEKLETLLTQFENTKLTEKEDIELKELRRNIQKLNVKDPTGEITQEQVEQMKTLFEQIKSNINKLAAIQIKEGKRQVSNAERAMETVDLFTQIEVYFLIVLAIVIQIIVLYRPKKKKDAA